MCTISDLDKTVHINGLKNILGHVCVMYFFQKMTIVHQKLEKSDDWSTLFCGKTSEENIAFCR